MYFFTWIKSTSWLYGFAFWMVRNHIELAYNKLFPARIKSNSLFFCSWGLSFFFFFGLTSAKRLFLTFLYEGSPTPRPWTSTGSWLIGKWATQAMGKCAKLHLRLCGIKLHMQNKPFPGAGLWSQKVWEPLIYMIAYLSVKV